MAREWKRSLEEYRYCVSLQHYENAHRYPGFFSFSIPINDRCSTVSFETHFRELAAKHIESWLEVVFWKMYSQANRRDNVTNQVAIHLHDNEVRPETLLQTCDTYVQNDTRENLKAIVQLLGFRSSAIAIGATFPAFLRPDLYPMVDTRVAKWVGQSMQAHNEASPEAPQLTRPGYLDTKATVLTLSDFEFVHSWSQWCRYKANQLTEMTSIVWRPRDVEMAVFNAWGDKGKQHPTIHLEVLV